MTDPPSERQVLYALVAAGFLVVVSVLIVGAASAGLVPAWWTAVSFVAVGAVSIGVAVRWRDTRLVLTSTIGMFVAWTVGTLLVA